MSNMDDMWVFTKMALGFPVEKTAISLADIDLFNVYGKVKITLIEGEVTGVGDAGPTTILLNEKASSIPLCAATTVTLDAVGEIYRATGDPAVVLNGTGNAPVLKVAGLLSAFPETGGFVFGLAGLAQLIIELTQTGADATHAVRWTLWYFPLEVGAYVEAA